MMGAAASFATITAREANAGYRQYQARANCALTSTSPQFTMGSGGTLLNDSSTGYMEMACAFLESNAFTKGGVTGATVAYTDNHADTVGSANDTSVVAADCVAYAAASGGACVSPSASPSGFNSGTLSLSLQSRDTSVVSTAASDFAYVCVSLPSRESSARSEVRGYRLDN